MKYGIKSGIQYYKCNDCHRKFAGTFAPEGMRFPIDIIGESIGLFYNGLSLSNISWHMEAARNVSVNPATIWRWIIKYSQKADRVLNRMMINTSAQWIIHETVLKLCGMRVWFWDVIESESCFLLATHLTLTGNRKSAMSLLQEAKSKTIGMPKKIVSDGVTAYPDAIERLFGAYCSHEKIKSLSTEVNRDIIEVLQTVVRDRIGVMRGLKTMESADIISKGFIVHYNFVKPNHLLNNNTPAVAAGFGFNFLTWTEVVDFLSRNIEKFNREQPISGVFQ